jgi:hypothetical protein
MDLLGSAIGGNLQQQIAGQIGANPQQAGSAIQAALPMLLAGLTHQASQPGGAEQIHEAATTRHDGSELDDPAATATQAAQTGQGAAVVNHVLGDKQQVAHQAVAQASGIDAGQAAQVMAMLAPLVMGALSRVQRQQGLDAGGLANLLRGEHASVAQQQPGLMGLAGQLFGGAGAGAPDLGGLMKGLGGVFGGRG